MAVKQYGGQMISPLTAQPLLSSEARVGLLVSQQKANYFPEHVETFAKELLVMTSDEAFFKIRRLPKGYFMFLLLKSLSMCSVFKTGQTLGCARFDHDPVTYPV
ncbi:hypothetical protein YC2023_041975 [Brassica napus]